MSARRSLLPCLAIACFGLGCGGSTGKGADAPAAANPAGGAGMAGGGAGGGGAGGTGGAGPELSLNGKGTYSAAGSQSRPFNFEASGNSEPNGSEKFELKGKGNFTDAKGGKFDVTVDGELERHDRFSKPFAFVRVGAGSALRWGGDFGNYSRAPVRLEASAGAIPAADETIRYGLAFAYSSAAVDVDHLREEGQIRKDKNDKNYDAPLVRDRFQIFQLGIMGRYYFRLSGELWFGTGFDPGLAFMEGVRVRVPKRISTNPDVYTTDCPECRYDSPMSMEVYAGVPFELAYGARKDGGIYVSVEPMLLSNAIRSPTVLIPIGAGVEF